MLAGSDRMKWAAAIAMAERHPFHSCNAKIYTPLLAIVFSLLQLLSISSTNRSSSVTESRPALGRMGRRLAESASSNCGHRKPARLDFICP